MSAPEDVAPSLSSVRSSTPQLARSRRRLLSEPLHAGNLKAYLDGISLVDVQAVLSRRFLRHQQDRSIFSFLTDPGDGIPPHEAASAVLEELASKTEEIAIAATMAYRLIEAKGLWKGHPDPSVKSAGDLVRKLNSGRDVAQANIVIGASAMRERQTYVRLVDEAWRPGWLEAIPPSIRAPSWAQPDDLPRDLLVQITGNARQGISIATAVEGWKRHIAKRTDMGARRREKIRGPMVPHVLVSDVKSLNIPVKDSDKGRRTGDVFFPEDAPTDHLEVKLAAPKPLAKPRPGESATTIPTLIRKRGRDGSRLAGSPVPVRPNADEDSTAATREEWQRGKDGMMVKRVRNQLVRRLPTSEELIEADPSPQPITTTQNSIASVGRYDGDLLPRYDGNLPPRHDSNLPPRHDGIRDDDSGCDGPVAALTLGKFVDLYQELRSVDSDTAKMAARYCNPCRILVLRALASLEADLVPCAQGLRRVERHLHDGDKVPPGQDCGTSPRRATRMRVVPDSSDDSEVD
jgi:hypothetical protein